MNRLKKLIAPIKYDKKNYFIYFLTEIFDAFQAIFIVQIVALIIGAVEMQDISSLYNYVWRYGIIAFLILANAWIANIKHDVSFINIRSGILRNYAKRYIYLDNSEVEIYGTGKVHNIIKEGLNSRCALVVEILISSFVEILAIIYAFILVASQVPNWEYFFIFLGVFVLVLMFMTRAFKIIHKYRKKVKLLYIEMDKRLVKLLMSKFEVLQSNRIKKEQGEIHALLEEEKKTWIRGNMRKVALQNTGMAILSTLRILIFIVIGVGVINGHYQLAYFVLLVELIRIMNRYIRNIRDNMKQYTKAIVNVDKMREFFEDTPTRNYESGLPFVYKNGDIVCKDIHFDYIAKDQKKNVFKGFDLILAGGRKIALVGQSGGGKTTLIKLIAGYLFSQKGEILIDKQSLSKVKLTDYYKHVGYLTQEPNVFDGTIKENLLYGIQYDYNENDEYFQQKLEKVIKDARCEFIYDFKHKLKTQIGERGVRLSGGQKQRLAIAKIMLKNPNIILLDEPTSALDSISEQKIAEALHNLFKGRTVLVVAHRLQTVKESDEIIVIEEGEIIERGTHGELKKKGGKYKQMLDLQTSF